MDPQEVTALFGDKTGFAVTYELLGLRPTLSLQAFPGGGFREVYLVDGQGFWRVTESPVVRGKAEHTFVFVPYAAVSRVEAAITDAGRDALAGEDAYRGYVALAGSEVTIRMGEDYWEITGEQLVGDMAEDDPRITAILSNLFTLPTIAATSGISVMVSSPYTAEPE